MVYTRPIIGKMCFKVSLKYYVTLGIVMNKKTRVINASKHVEKGKHIYTVDGSWICAVVTRMLPRVIVHHDREAKATGSWSRWLHQVTSHPQSGDGGWMLRLLSWLSLFYTVQHPQPRERSFSQLRWAFPYQLTQSTWTPTGMPLGPSPRWF